MANREELAELYVKLSADVAAFQGDMNRALGDFDRRLGETERKTSTAAQKLEQAELRLASVGQKMTLGISLPMLAAAGGMTKLAMDAVESENLFEVSMGGMAKAARDWSEQLREDLGLNAYEVRRTVGLFNTMIESMGLSTDAAYAMSQGITQLKYDLASYYNLSTSQAEDKLRAGLAGETEPLRQLGINISEAETKAWALRKGLLGVNEQMSEGQKVLARYGLILERTAKAQGDLARTADSPANQLRKLEQQATQLGTEMGKKLLNVVTPALKALNDKLADASRAWDGMGDAGQTAVLGLASVLGAAGPLMLALSLAIHTVRTLKAELATLGPLMAKVPWGALGTAGLTVGIPALIAWKADQEARAGVVTPNAMATATQQQWQSVARQNPAAVVRPGPTLAELERDDRYSRPPQPDWAKEWEAQADKSAEKQQTAADRLAERLSAAGLSTKEYVDAMASQEPASKAAADATEALRLRLVGLQDAQGGASAAIDQAQESYRRAQERVSDLSDKLSEAKRRLEDLANPRLVGMGEFDDKIFALEQKISALELRRLQVQQSARGPADQRQYDALGKQIEQLQREKDILEHQRELKYAPALRQIQQAANPPGPEMTPEQALKQIRDTRAEITSLEKKLADATEEAKAQEQKVKDLEEANKGLGGAIAEAQKQLQLQEDRQRAVNDALADAYQWLLQDRDRVRGLGDEGVKAADKVDAAVRGMLSTVRSQAETEAQAAIDAIKKAQDAYDQARRDMAIGLAQPAPVNAPNLYHPVARAGGGPVDEPVVGVGQETGRTWTFAENDTEWVMNRAQMAAREGGAASPSLTIDTGGAPVIEMHYNGQGGREEGRAFGQEAAQEFDRWLTHEWNRTAGQGIRKPIGS